jgi:transposase-like protein
MMNKGPRCRFTVEFKEQAVARLSMPGATGRRCEGAGDHVLAAEGWRLELEAAGSAEAVRRQKAEAAELAELRRENRHLKGEVEVMRKASAFFAPWAMST